MNEISQATLYGRCAFTTVRIIDGEAWLWEKHWRRLCACAERLGISLDGQNIRHLHRNLDQALRTAAVSEGLARITLHDGRATQMWGGDNELTSVSILTRRPRAVDRSFRITVSPHLVNSTSPLVGLKTCNYLEQTLSMEEARSSGCNEAIRVNECGHIASACMANLFWLKGDRLYTPALSTGSLPGTTREFVLENLDCEEVTAEIRELEDAEAVFLTSAGLGVVAVDEFDGRPLADSDHPILHLVPQDS